ncbi:MAG: FAD binding domain-containing protein [Deltaproteobacteria bacterium]|nr:FAD binding domain-containing protein [Deltaproteobacteria bacterium]
MMLGYLRLESLDELTEMLWADGPICLMLAGATAVMSRPDPFGDKRMLLDIGRILELRGVALDESGGVRIGAATCLQQAALHPAVRRRARLLGLACAAIGTPQLRNRATLGGHLLSDMPAHDALPALICLDAEIQVRSRDRQRTIPAASLAEALDEQAELLAPDELIESVRIPSRAGHTVAFFHRAGPARVSRQARPSVAFAARRRGDGRLDRVRIALGGCGAAARELPESAAALEGQKLAPAAVERAARALSGQLGPGPGVLCAGMLSRGLYEIHEHMRMLARRRARRQRR